MADFYPLARGHMLEVWGIGECPICGEEMSALDYERDPDEELGLLGIASYTCDYCNIILCYVCADTYSQYHEVPDNEKRYFIERCI